MSTYSTPSRPPSAARHPGAPSRCKPVNENIPPRTSLLSQTPQSALIQRSSPAPHRPAAPLQPIQEQNSNPDIDAIQAQMLVLQEKLARAKEREQQHVHADDNVAEKLAAMQASLDDVLASNAELKRKLATTEAGRSGGNEGGDDDAEEGSIPRPKGNAGQDFSIQVEMKLATSEKKTQIYKGIQRYLRDLAIRSGMNWELPWAQISAEEKVKLYRVARKQHPYLKKFRNDWATEELVKQYFANKRKLYYRNAWLPVPDKYAHMGDVSRKRDPSASRVKTARKVLQAKQSRSRRRQRREPESAAAEERDNNDEDEEMEQDEYDGVRGEGNDEGDDNALMDDDQ